MSHPHCKKDRVKLLSFMLAVALTANTFSAPGYSRSDVGKRNSAALETHIALLRANGKIAYSSGSIHAYEPDGSNQTKLPTSRASLRLTRKRPRAVRQYSTRLDLKRPHFH